MVNWDLSIVIKVEEEIYKILNIFVLIKNKQPHNSVSCATKFLIN